MFDTINSVNEYWVPKKKKNRKFLLNNFTRARAIIMSKIQLLFIALCPALGLGLGLSVGLFCQFFVFLVPIILLFNSDSEEWRGWSLIAGAPVY